MPTTIDSAGITFDDATSLTSAVLAANSVGATQITNGSVTAAKLGTNEQKQICKAFVAFNGSTSPYAISNSFNVSSVTRNASTNFTINYTTGTFYDVNYTVLVSMSNSVTPSVAQAVPYIGAITTSSTQVFAVVSTTGSAPATAADYIAIAVFDSN